MNSFFAEQFPRVNPFNELVLKMKNEFRICSDAERVTLCNICKDLSTRDDSFASQFEFKNFFLLLVAQPIYSWTKYRKTMATVYEISKKCKEDDYFRNYVCDTFPVYTQHRFELLSIVFEDLNTEQLYGVFDNLSVAIKNQDLCSVTTALMRNVHKMYNSKHIGLFDVMLKAITHEDINVRDRAYRNWLLIYLNSPALMSTGGLHKTASELIGAFGQCSHLWTPPQQDEITEKLTNLEITFVISVTFALQTRVFDEDIFKFAKKYGVLSRHSDVSRHSLNYVMLFEEKLNDDELFPMLKRILYAKVLCGDVKTATAVNEIIIEKDLHQEIVPLYISWLHNKDCDRLRMAAMRHLNQYRQVLTTNDHTAIVSYVTENLKTLTVQEVAYLLPEFKSFSDDNQCDLVEFLRLLHLGYNYINAIHKPTETPINMTKDMDPFMNKISELLTCVGSPNVGKMASIQDVKAYYGAKIEITDPVLREHTLTNTIRKEWSDEIVNSLGGLAFFSMTEDDSLVPVYINFVVDTVLRVQDKRVVNEGCDVLAKMMTRADKQLGNSKNNVLINIFNKIINLARDPESTFRPRALWRILMILYQNVTSTTTKVKWIKTIIENLEFRTSADIVLVRFTKVLCAFVKSNVYDLVEFYPQLLMGAFMHANRSFEVVAIQSNLVNAIYNRTIPQSPLVTPLFQFVRAHRGLFEVSVAFLTKPDAFTPHNYAFTSIICSSLTRLVALDYALYNVDTRCIVRIMFEALEVRVLNSEGHDRDLAMNLIVNFLPLKSAAYPNRCPLDDYLNMHLTNPDLGRDVLRLQYELMHPPAPKSLNEAVVSQVLLDRIKKIKSHLRHQIVEILTEDSKFSVLVMNAAYRKPTAEGWYVILDPFVSVFKQITNEPNDVAIHIRMLYNEATLDWEWDELPSKAVVAQFIEIAELYKSC